MIFNSNLSFSLGGSLSRYSPLIDYSWRVQTLGDNSRQLIDEGSKPKYHADMFTGQGVNFNGVDQLIPFTPIAQYTIYTFNGVMQYIVGALDVNSILPIGTYQNIIYLDFNLTQEQKDRYVSNPETFLYRDSGVIKSDTLSQAEIDNVVAYLPLCEKDEYVRDMTSYSEGNNLVTTIDDLLTNGDEVTTYSSNLVDSFDLAVTTVGTNGYRPIQTQTINGTNGDIVLIKFNAVINSGVAQIKAIKFNTGVQNIDYDIKNGENTIIVKCDSDTSVMSLYWNGTLQGDVSVSNYETVLLSGIYPINNFTNSCREDVQNLNKGLQTAKWLRDDLGVPYGLSSYLEFDGVSYTDTGWIPSTSFTIEDIVKVNGVFEQDGQYTDDNRQTVLSTLATNEVSARVGSFTITTSVLSNGYHYIAYGYDADNLQMFLSVDGQTIIIDNVGDFIGGNGTYVLGILREYLNVNNTNSLNTDKRLFKVHDKALTQEEITKNYNKYVNRGLLGEYVTYNEEIVTHNNNPVWV